jgi:hypothetical protein
MFCGRELSKLFSDFASLRHQLMIADKQSKLDSLDLKQVRKRLHLTPRRFLLSVVKPGHLPRQVLDTHSK